MADQLTDPTNTNGLQETHEEYREFQDVWADCRIVVCGSRAIKAAGVRFVSKLDEETTDEFDARRQRAAVYESADATLDLLLGALFRKPGKQNLPTAVDPHLDNIDLAGMPYDGFKQRIASEHLEIGRFGVLVDYSVEQGRPFWKAYETEQIRNWSYSVRNGRMVLDQITLYETVPRRSRSGFGTENVPQYRVLELDEANLFQSRVYVLDQTNSTDKIQLYREDVEQATTPNRQGIFFNEIPFVCFGRIDLLLTPQKPPLLAICDLELDHYRLDVDLKHHLHLTALDGLFVIGDGDPTTEKKYYLGGTRANRLQADADVKFVGVGTAWDGIKQEKEMDEQRMALLGARMLIAPKRAAETAEALTIQQQGEAAKLSTISHAIGLGLTKCWQYHVRWMGGDEKAVHVELNRDFSTGKMTPEEVASQLSLVIAHQLSQETFLENLFAGEISREPDEEQGRLDAEAIVREENAPEVDPNAPPVMPAEGTAH